MSKAAVLTVTLLAGVFLLVGAGGTKTANDKRYDSFVIHFKKDRVSKKDDCNKWEIVKGIRYYRANTWSYNWQAGSSFTRFSKWRPKHSCAFLNYLAVSAQKKSKAARRAFENWFNRTYAKWDCIHRHEAGWHGDNNPTYDGGLQMDSGFQNTYGPEFVRAWGNASNWPVWAQLRAAERAYASRGFGPWPTRHYCGL